MSVSVNIRVNRKLQILSCVILLFINVLPLIAQQMSNEKVVPFEELLARRVDLRPELKNVHPRLFFTAKDLPSMRERAKGADKELWDDVLKDLQTLKRDAPDPKDEDLYKSGLDSRKKGAISQYEMAFQIAETSYAYAIEQDEKYLEAAKKWTIAACEMPIWGYTYNKPNVDLPPVHLLYAVRHLATTDNFTKSFIISVSPFAGRFVISTCICRRRAKICMSR